MWAHRSTSRLSQRPDASGCWLGGLDKTCQLLHKGTLTACRGRAGHMKGCLVLVLSLYGRLQGSCVLMIVSA